jgi:hypothetical protein
MRLTVFRQLAVGEGGMSVATRAGARPQRRSIMLADVAPYLMSFCAMSFAAISALTLIAFVNRWD